MEQIDQAKTIAIRGLRACYRSQGIVAGNHHFTDYWARDGFFAAMGAKEIGDEKIVEEMVELFFEFQREDGLIPYRVMNGPMHIGKYFGREKKFAKPRPTYRLRGLGAEVIDGTTLTILNAAMGRQKKYLRKIKKGLDYLEKREFFGLLWDGPMCEWNDAVWKIGNLLYSNIIYWKMLEELEKWYGDEKVEELKNVGAKKKQIEGKIRERLWNGRYFADWYDYKRQDYLYPFGNCLAVAWGFCRQEEVETIMREVEKTKHNFTLETNSPSYSWWRVDLVERLAGMADYQNAGTLWWQTGTSYLAALIKMGKDKEAVRWAKIMAKKVVDDQKIYECYERDGLPVKRWWYRSEEPFAWASGMIIWSLNKIN